MTDCHPVAHRRDASAVAIVGTGSYLPATEVTNAQLESRLNVPPGWIEERTGVRARRVAREDEATSDLATAAGEAAVADAGIDRREIDLVVVATSTPDQPLPATACTVQANLGLAGCPAFDVDAVCTGFLYALEVARSMMTGNPSLRHALVIGADTYSRVLDHTDRRTSVLFGDGAGAVVLGRAPVGITDLELGADGSMADYVRIPAGGSRRPTSADTLRSGGHLFRMEGRAVRLFAEQIFADLVDRALARARLDVGDLGLVVPHQANVRILERCAGRAGLSPGQIAITADTYGNTGAASVPVTLHQAVRDGRVRPRDKVLFVAFGGGMTWGSALMTWAGRDDRGPGHASRPTELQGSTR
ncbi:3-oxoacyl-ACP synthase III family protein [Actinomadura kijaniata]|uniref:3-oxoacyl-ACP synthase III family protein n=1 Tax=Actinomadura kijaniata TaxID=46161 RepID=UPI000829D2F1|nr:beta-ketoacyl-ACP synthase III [Actinomadura kijaniata]